MTDPAGQHHEHEFRVTPPGRSMDRPGDCRCGITYEQARAERAAAGDVGNFERFLSKVDTSGDCWIWTAGRHRGYGQFWHENKMVRAHRWLYQLVVGPVPEGLALDHLCRNRACVRPSHLEAVTQRENILRGVGTSARNAAKTHCHKGHPFDSENTRITPKGYRVCRACHCDRELEGNRQRRAAARARRTA